MFSQVFFIIAICALSINALVIPVARSPVPEPESAWPQWSRDIGLSHELEARFEDRLLPPGLEVAKQKALDQLFGPREMRRDTGPGHAGKAPKREFWVERAVSQDLETRLDDHLLPPGLEVAKQKALRRDTVPGHAGKAPKRESWVETAAISARA